MHPCHMPRSKACRICLKCTNTNDLDMAPEITYNPTPIHMCDIAYAPMPHVSIESVPIYLNSLSPNDLAMWWLRLVGCLKI